MDAYIISCNVDIQKLTSPISSVERLELHQISQGLVRELYLCMTRSSTYTFKDFMNWLWQLLTESQLTNFNPSGENIIRKHISKIKKNLPSKNRKSYLDKQFDFNNSSVQLPVLLPPATLSVQSLRTQSPGEIYSPDSTPIQSSDQLEAKRNN